MGPLVPTLVPSCLSETVSPLLIFTTLNLHCSYSLFHFGEHELGVSDIRQVGSYISFLSSGSPVSVSFQLSCLTFTFWPKLGCGVQCACSVDTGSLHVFCCSSIKCFVSFNQKELIDCAQQLFYQIALSEHYKAYPRSLGPR